MGNWLSWIAPPQESGWTHSRIYRANTKDGTYSLIASQALNFANQDTTYYDQEGLPHHWYKYSFYNQTTQVESPLSEPSQGEFLETFYTTPRLVAELLQVRNQQGLCQFDGNTRPTIYEVIRIIQRKEDWIDNMTGHAWRNRYSGTTSYNAPCEYEYYDDDLPNMGSGRPIYLRHRNIQPLSKAKGDALELWDGNGYVDYLATKQEGREKDFWLDYLDGVLFINDYYPRGKRGVRIKYRYGESVVPKDIEELCTILTAIDLLYSDDRSSIIPESNAGISINTKAELWRKRADEIIQQRVEFRFR